MRTSLNTGHSLVLTEISVNAERLMSDVLAGTFSARVRQDVRSGARQGVNGTPSFFINGVRYDGSYNVESLFEALTAHPAW